MEWILIPVAGLLVLAGVVAIAAAWASAAGEVHADRAPIWAAGFSPGDLRLLAGLATLARLEVGADAVEVVLDGVVVAGSRLPPGRLGAMVDDLDSVGGTVVPIAGGALVVIGQVGEWDVERLERLVARAGHGLGVRTSDRA